MTAASGHRYIVRRDGDAVRATEIQSDCPRAFVSANVRVITNRETLFRTAMTVCVDVCLCVPTLYFRTLRPDIVSSASSARVRLARDSLLLSARPLTTAALSRRVFLVVRYILLN